MDESYRQALRRYYASPLYRNLHRVVAAAVLVLQALVLAHVPWAELGLWCFPVFVGVYVVADFVNGLVHMHMDNWREYNSPLGPLIAIFHLHHVKPRYTDKPVLAVYAIECGYKNWLVPTLALTLFAQVQGVPAPVNFALAAFGIVSCFAEVSHYLCHNVDTPLVRLAQRLRLVLSPEHHDRHHRYDNVSYAFLNGVSDPLLDRIAAHFYPGYKTTTDVDSGACFLGSEGLR